MCFGIQGTLTQVTDRTTILGQEGVGDDNKR